MRRVDRQDRGAGELGQPPRAVRVVRVAVRQHDLLDALARPGRGVVHPAQVPLVVRARVHHDGRRGAGLGDQPGVGAVQRHQRRVRGQSVNKVALKEERITVVYDEKKLEEARRQAGFIRETDKDKIDSVVALTGGRDERFGKVGRLWVPKFLYFQKYEAPPQDVQLVADADVYKLTLYWDKIDGDDVVRHYKRLRRGGIPQEYSVAVDRKTGAVRILRMFLREMVKLRAKRGPDRGRTFHIPNNHWGIPDAYDCWAAGHIGIAQEEYMRRLFVEAALMYESAAMGSMIRVAVKKGKLTAVFGVEIKRTPYFFKDRDVVLNDKGSKARIFHIVRPHERVGSKTGVRMHFRGLKEFAWAGYKVKITVPGRDHFFLPEWDVGAWDMGSKQAAEYKGKTLGMDEVGDMLSEQIDKGLGAI